MQTVTIPKKEYDRLKQIEKEMALDESLQRAIRDAENGRVIEY